MTLLLSILVLIVALEHLFIMWLEITVPSPRAALRELFSETTLQRNDFLSARYEAEIWLKRETPRPSR